VSITGIGTDICEVSRIEKLLNEKGEQFIKRVLTPEEIKQKKQITPNHLAKRYAAKEAVAKALGCGIGESLSFQDIQITNQQNGKPELTVKGKEELTFHLSISDETEYAVAMVVAETK